MAVMVRDIEATAEAAGTSSAKALLALEERPAMPASGLSRGWVTRHWLEPSGYPGVPAGFIVDRRGVIVWMGDPAEMKPAFYSILKGEWDVGAAREAWRLKRSDEEIQNRGIVLDLTEMFFEGDIDATNRAIADAEEQWPALGLDKEFNMLKLDALTMGSVHHEAALAHYCRCADLFQSDPHVQARLATRILSRMLLDNRALQIVIERLTVLEDHINGTLGGSQRDVINGLAVSLTLADALTRAGLSEEATKQMDKAGLLSEAAGIPEHIRLWTASEIERLRGRLGNGARIIDTNGGMG
ncbi:hypothetical protein [Neorhizobium sp. DT-125]|uniref:hypothetical protein n=1 Tax=Neorhizobium sp. DT-125 TaxID=3396163 RepID=UPI003F1CDDDE